MADVHDEQTRSYNMSRIRGKNTRPEIMVRKFLYSNGIRYRLHVGSLPGKPDIVIPKYKTIVDVRGCFWHGHRSCRFGSVVKCESSLITERIKSAKIRDRRNERRLKKLGWHLIVVWDSCELEVKKKSSTKRDIILKNLLKEIFKKH